MTYAEKVEVMQILVIVGGVTLGAIIALVAVGLLSTLIPNRPRRP